MMMIMTLMTMMMIIMLMIMMMGRGSWWWEIKIQEVWAAALRSWMLYTAKGKRGDTSNFSGKWQAVSYRSNKAAYNDYDHDDGAGDDDVWATGHGGHFHANRSQDGSTTRQLLQTNQTNTLKPLELLWLPHTFWGRNKLQPLWQKKRNNAQSSKWPSKAR